MEVGTREEINTPNHYQRLKVSVIREEFLELTGHPYKAILLNQLYYWTQKVRDFDDMLKEEQLRLSNDNIELRHGWIYKSARDFVEETLLKVSKHTFYRHMKHLIDKGWLETKEHPTHAWDKTTFYRLNLEAIYQDLKDIGYDLPTVFQDSYRKVYLKAAETFMSHPATSMSHPATHNKITDKKEDKDLFLFKDTYKGKSKRASARDINDLKSQEENEVFNIQSYIQKWNEYMKEESVLSGGQEASLKESINKYFHDDIDEWEEFCDHIKQNDFLMGENPSKWIISLKWLSIPENIVKIIKKFKPHKASPKPLLLKKDEQLIQEGLQYIETIKDPVWKEVCKEILQHWGPGANVPYSSPHFEGIYRRKGQTRLDIETFLKSKLWEAKLGSVNDRVALLYLTPENELSYKTYYQQALVSILSSIYSNIRRVTWTTDQKRFDDHWKYFEDTEGEKRRDV